MPNTARDMNFKTFNDAFLYDPITGIITNKVNRGKAREGEEPGSLSPDGYRRVKINGEAYLAHRIVWLLRHGEIDLALQIDHINHVRNDNRIVNLRLVTNRVNTSYLRGDYPLGVYFHKQSGKLKAQIHVNGKRKSLGYFDDVEKAAQAYQDALALVE
tara:strand:+ start:38 stop:511 length:474 start_codon:yes stop_codon:yes gene_type:complete